MGAVLAAPWLMPHSWHDGTGWVAALPFFTADSNSCKLSENGASRHLASEPVDFLVAAPALIADVTSYSVSQSKLTTSEIEPNSTWSVPN